MVEKDEGLMYVNVYEITENVQVWETEKQGEMKGRQNTTTRYLEHI